MGHIRGPETLEFSLGLRTGHEQTLQIGPYPNSIPPQCHGFLGSSRGCKALRQPFLRELVTLKLSRKSYIQRLLEGKTSAD